MELVDVLSLVAGATVGVVLSHSRGPDGSGPLTLAAALQVVLSVAAAVALGVEATWVPGLVGVAAFVLSGAHVWRRSPLLDGEGYWSRVWYVLRDRRTLEAAEQERRDGAAADLEGVGPGRA